MKKTGFAAILLITSWLAAAAELNYATYFGGPGGGIAGMREMPDGSLLLVANGAGVPGISLNTRALDPSGCVIARLSPARQRFDFVSYLDRLDCTSMDLDPSGRILVAGPNYIARISADGRSLDHLATFSTGCLQSIRSGPDGVAYLSGYQCLEIFPEVLSPLPYAPLGGAILRYNFVLGRMDAKTYFSAHITDMARSGSGALYVYGAGNTITLKNPIASFPKGDDPEHPYVAAFSPDLNLTFATYLDGLASRVGPDAVVPDEDGTIWISGSIPETYTMFAARVDPASASVLVTSRSGVVTSSRQPRQAALRADGELCTKAATRGGDIVLACTTGTSIQIEALIPNTSTMDSSLVLTRNAGFWTADTWVKSNLFDPVPYSLKATAAVPYRTSYGDDLVLRHYSADPPVPRLSGSVPVTLLASERASLSWIESIPGSGFLPGMLLELDGHRYPLNVRSFNAAEISAQQFAPNVRAGEYQGRLINPGPPEAVSSVIPVIVRNVRPHIVPFVTTNRANVWRVQGAVYETSTAYWNGVPRPLTFLPNGAVELELPASSDSGELRLVNPPPGGGEQRTILRSTGSQPDPNVRIAVSQILADPDRGILYALEVSSCCDWRVVAYSVPDGRMMRDGVVPNSAGVSLVDWQITSDGAYIYLAGQNRRVYRVGTVTLQTEVEFVSPLDVPLSSGTAQKLVLRALPGQPQSVLVTTAAGRMTIYDGDRPRVYSTSDYPSDAVMGFVPLFATPTHIYAIPNPSLTVGWPTPCLVRYPYDRLGFAQPEDICDIAGGWGRWEEMKTYGSMRYLQYGNEYWSISAPTTSNGWMFARKLWCEAAEGVYVAQNLDLNGNSTVSNLGLIDLVTGNAVPFYPPSSFLLGTMMTGAFVRGALVYHDYSLGKAYSSAVILPDWRQYAFR